MEGLERFIFRIDNFLNLPMSAQMDFYAYFLTEENEQSSFKSLEIKNCFQQLKLNPYTNIGGYLNTNSKGRKRKFLKNKDGSFSIERKFIENLKQSIGTPSLPDPTNSDFLSIELFTNTRGYILQLARQIINSYDTGLYDGCSVLSRKLIEILIIECFEKYGIDNLIKKGDGSFFYLSDLITELLKEPNWNLGRNFKRAIPKIKRIGDLSAHNRRYISRKSDIDRVSDDFRIVIEELIHLIDYPNWK